MADSKNDPKENPSLNSSPAAPQSNDVTAMNEDNNNIINGDTNNEGRQSRTPFTDLSQVDADLALARTLQEQVSIYILYLYLLSFYFLVVCVLICWTFVMRFD